MRAVLAGLVLAALLIPISAHAAHNLTISLDNGGDGTGDTAVGSGALQTVASGTYIMTFGLHVHAQANCGISLGNGNAGPSGAQTLVWWPNNGTIAYQDEFWSDVEYVRSTNVTGGTRWVQIRGTYNAPPAPNDKIGIFVAGWTSTRTLDSTSCLTNVQIQGEVGYTASGAPPFEDQAYIWTLSSGPFAGRTIGIFQADHPDTPPAAPVLSGSINGNYAVLTWTVPASSLPILGYNVTRVNHAGGDPHTFSLSPSALSFTEPITGRNRTYTVTAWSALGTGDQSNNVTLRIVKNLFGNDGSFYGQQGRTGLASSMDISPNALDVFLGLVFTLTLATAGAVFLGGWGAGSFGIVGIIASFAFSLFPLWVFFFVVMFTIAGLILLAMLAGRGSSTP